MKKIEKQVLQTRNFFVAKDGTEFDTYGKCAEYEYELAMNDANKFDFKWRDDFEDYFTVVYHSSMKKAFAEDLSTILCCRFGLSEPSARDYDTSNILHTFKKVLGCELVDGHEYSVDCNYTVDDELKVCITDITERNRVQNVIPKCREVLFENQPARDFIEIAKRQVNYFGSATVRTVLETLIEEICGK